MEAPGGYDPPFFVYHTNVIPLYYEAKLVGPPGYAPGTIVYQTIVLLLYYRPKRGHFIVVPKLMVPHGRIERPSTEYKTVIIAFILVRPI